MCSIGLPGPHELWIEALARTAALQAAKRAEQRERLFQRSTAGEADEHLPLAVALRFLVGPARQLPQSPLPSLVRTVGVEMGRGNRSIEGRGLSGRGTHRGTHGTSIFRPGRHKWLAL